MSSACTIFILDVINLVFYIFLLHGSTIKLYSTYTQLGILIINIVDFNDKQYLVIKND